MDTFELVQVKAEDALYVKAMKNLLKMYCYEWSQYTGMDVNASGVYTFERFLPSYWKDDERKAFLLRCTAPGKKAVWAGFALLDKDFILHKDYDYSMAEFFVMYKYRRHGAGQWMANTLFERFPGRWEVGRNPKNLPSVAFWDRVVSAYTGGKYELNRAVESHRYPDGTLGDVFAFSTGKPADKPFLENC